MGRLHAPLPSGRSAVRSERVQPDPDDRDVTHGSSPRSAPLRSLRCRLPYSWVVSTLRSPPVAPLSDLNGCSPTPMIATSPMGRLHAPLPSGPSAVDSLIHGSSPRSAPLRSLRCPI